MKAILSERNLVLVLFVMVFVVFSLAHEDSKKMEKGHLGTKSTIINNLTSIEQVSRTLLVSDIPDSKVQNQKTPELED
ncbi:MAG: hypothetical protein ABUT20_50650 [Bacteroidota bacterium]